MADQVPHMRPPVVENLGVENQFVDTTTLGRWLWGAIAGTAAAAALGAAVHVMGALHTYWAVILRPRVWERRGPSSSMFLRAQPPAVRRRGCLRKPARQSPTYPPDDCSPACECAARGGCDVGVTRWGTEPV